MGKKKKETTLIGTRLPNDIMEYIQKKVEAREYSNLSHGVIRLITLGIKYEKEKENKSLKKLFKRSPVGMGVTDSEGNIVVWNNHLLTLTGYEEDELKTMNVGDLYSYQEQRLNLVEILEDRDHIKDCFVELKKKDGDIIGVLLSVEKLSLTGEDRFLTIAHTIS